jgi:transketolase
MTVLYPADSEEARKATLAAAVHPGPVYLRFAREKTPVMTTASTPFEIGKVQTVWKPSRSNADHSSGDKKPEVVIFATGPLLYQALLAAQTLEGSIEVVVVNVTTVKPLDLQIVKIAKSAGAVVTVEEHQIAGGMGSAIAEMLAERAPVPIEFVGVRDSFGQSGTPEELIAHYGLDSRAIVEKVRTACRRKR